MYKLGEGEEDVSVLLTSSTYYRTLGIHFMGGDCAIWLDEGLVILSKVQQQTLRPSDIAYLCRAALLACRKRISKNCLISAKT